MSTTSTDSNEDLSLHEYLTLSFSKHPKLFNCVHINAQSIVNDEKFLNFQATFTDCSASAILVSETWFTPKLPNSRVKLPGYKCIRHDRVHTTGGGVAIYLRDSFRYNILKTSDGNVPGIEYLLIEVWCSGSKLLLGVFYRPPARTFIDEFETLLMDYLPHYSEVILMGDFNCDLLKNVPSITSFRDVLSSVNLNILPTGTTFHLPDYSSILDLMLVMVPRKVKNFGITGAPFSPHDLMYLSYDLRCPKSQHKIIQYRDYKHLDVELLVSEARASDWGSIRRCVSVDEKVEILTNIITSLFEKHIPLKTSRVRRPPAPWFTPEIKRLMKSRDRSHAKFRRSLSREHWNKYRSLRNQCNRLCRDSRRKDIAENVGEGQSASTWQYLKSLEISDSGADESLNTLPIDLDVLNNFFVKPPVIVSPDVKERALCSVRLENPPNVEQFTFSHVGENHVLEALNNMKSNAVGNDRVALKFIKPFISLVVPSLTHIFNFSLSNNVFPSTWKESIVVPIPKISEPKEPTDFRPISLLPLFSKVFERIVHCQVGEFLQNNNLLNPLQSGFRAGHSTSSALLKVTEDVRRDMDRQKVTILLLLDFSKAFDTVDHDILLARLSFSFNFSQGVVSWFRSYLSNRKQCVKSQSSLSEYLTVIAGVPQGSVLGPLLFSLFVNSITAVFKNCSFHMYADDLQLYLSTFVENFNEALELVNSDLQSLLEWTSMFGILPNPKKFQAITIGSSVLLSRLDLVSLNLVFNQTLIPFTETVKNLGVIIDSTLSWGPHIQTIVKKCFSSLYALNKLRRLLPIHIKKLLCSTLIFPIVEYADIVYQSLNCQLKYKLQKIQNACVRFVFGLKKYDHVSISRESLHWMVFNKRRTIHMLRLLWRILNYNQPSYLRNFFNVLGDEPRLNNRAMLSIPMHRTSFVGNSFVVQSVRIWNNLPVKLRISSSFTSFKKDLDDLLSNLDI